MRFLHLAALAALSFVTAAGAASAADLVPKAPPQVVGFPYSGSGFYYGVNTFAEIDKTTVDVAGTQASLFQAGTALGGTIGYQRGNGNTFVAFEMMVNYHNVGSTGNMAAVNAVSADSRYSLEQRIKFGGPLATVLGVLPSQIQPVLPGMPSIGNQVGPSHPYLMVGLHEQQQGVDIADMSLSKKRWQLRPAVGAGIMTQFTSGIALDTWVEYNPKTSGFVAGGLSAKPEQGYRIGAALLY